MFLTRWEPYGNFSAVPKSLFSEIDKLFNGSWDDGVMKVKAWSPRVDIYEETDKVVLKAELPGIEPKDVDIHIDENTLYLKGERKIDSEVKEENLYRMERAYGTFGRSFALPISVESEKVLAEYKDGVLKITLPKREKSKSKQIKVAVK